MMAGNPNWWSMNGMHPLPRPHFLLAASDSDSSPPHLHQDRPVGSWSQLLLGGLGGGEEERLGEQQKKLEKWEDEALNLNIEESSSTQTAIDCNYNYGHADEEFQRSTPWPFHHDQPPPPLIPLSSCITNTIFSFSSSNNHHHNQHHSSQCNGSVSKKARAKQSSPKPPLKTQVRKEKLGDRITALHQLVSPFGKTDTASVLSEAIGYIRFLHAQIEALTSPYMRNAAGNRVQERRCMLSEELSQVQDSEDDQSDLRSRGLCLVPISCTQHVGNDISADFWAPAALGRGF